MKFLFALLALLGVASISHAGTYTASTCSYADVNAAINNTTPGTSGSPQHLAVNGDVIVIPSGTCAWASVLTINVAITVQGAGAESSTSWVPGSGTATTGTDQTIINPAVGGSSLVTVNTTLGNPETRITGIAFIENSGSGNAGSGIIHLNGQATNVRIDHCHFYVSKNSKYIYVGGNVLGVADHNFMDVQAGEIADIYIFSNGVGWNGGSDTAATGDPSFADGDHFGTGEFFYVEDSYINAEGANYLTDCDHGGRGVLRYLTAVNSQGLASHGTTSTYRGCRAMEIYQSIYSFSPGHAGAIGHPNSGTMLAWGITSAGFGNIVGTAMERILGNEGDDSEELLPAPNGWGYCGTNYATGTATTTNGSTAVTGTGFSTSWPTPFNMIIPGALCEDLYGDTKGNVCKVTSVQSSTALTLAQVANASVTGVTFTVGSPWDGHALATGYACFDSPTRGVGDLLNGAFFPSRVDTVTGTQTWPNQALSPIYAFDNTYSPTGTGGQGIVADNTGTLAANRDYYVQYGTYGQAGSNCTGSPCNISVGVNQSSRAPVNGTDTCAAGTDPMTGGAAPGVGWWDTTNNTLYVCNPANTWGVYYTPYTYPHPLAGGTPQASAPSCTPTSGAVPQTVTCTNPNSGTTIVCYATGATTPATNGSGTACSTGTQYTAPLSISSAETLNVIAGLAGDTDSPVVSYTYTAGCATPTAVGPYISCGSAFGVAGSAVTSLTVNYSPTAGNDVEIFVTYCTSATCANFTVPVGSVVVSDNVNNPETACHAAPNSPYTTTNTSVPDYVAEDVYLCKNLPSGITSFTLGAANAANVLTVGLVEWKTGSIATSGYFENVDQSSGSLGNTPVASATLQTSGPTVHTNDLITGMFSLCGGTIHIVPGAGYTPLILNPSANLGWTVLAQPVSSTGTQSINATWTPVATSGNCNLSNVNNYDTWYGVVVPLVGATQTQPNGDAFPPGWPW